MNLLKLKGHDWLITVIIVLLTLIGTVTIFSTTINSVSEAQGAGTLPKQFIFIIVGFSIYFVLSLLDISWLQTKTILTILYILIIASLIYVKLFGQTIAGTNRWVDIGFFSFQPSEYSKIILILITAGVFTISNQFFANNKVQFVKGKAQTSNGKNNLLGTASNFLAEHELIKKYLVSTLLTLPIIGLTLIQPSLGNAIIIGCIWILMLFVVFPNQLRLTLFLTAMGSLLVIISQFISVTRLDYELQLSTQTDSLNLIVIILASALMAVSIFFGKFKPLLMLLIPLLTVSLFFGTILGWNKVLTNYQKDRIDTFVQGPESDPLGTGYQVRQSKVAIGAGRFYGRGFLQGTQSNLNVLTQAHTDFAFAALSEQFGFVGSFIVLVLYLVLIIRILRIGLNSANEFGMMVSLGVAALILLHVFINIGMNLGKLPVTGIPLPLISYGGSSIFVILISLGLVQSIAGSKRAVDISDNLMLRSQSSGMLITANG